MERRRQDLEAREQAIEPRQKRVSVLLLDPMALQLALFDQQDSQYADMLSSLQVEASQKAVKQERDAVERQRTKLRRKNAALFKQ
jgi:hypothetical protein